MIKDTCRTLVFIAATTFIASAALAADGAAKLSFPFFMASLELEQTGDSVTGYAYNMAGNGNVKLEKKGDHWEGRFGLSNVTVREVKARDDGFMISVSTLPGGFVNFYVVKTRKGYSVRGYMPYGQSAWARLEGNHFNGGRDNFQFGLDQKEDRYTGSANLRLPGGRMEFSSAELTYSGTLTPNVLIAKDPALFTLLYVLSYNMPR